MKHIFFLVNSLALLIAVGSNLFALAAYLKIRLAWVKHFMWGLLSVSVILVSQTIDSYVIINSVDNYFIKSIIRLIGVLGCALCIYALPLFSNTFFGQKQPVRIKYFFTGLSILQPVLYVVYELSFFNAAILIFSGISLLLAFAYTIAAIWRHKKNARVDQRNLIRSFTILMLVAIPFILLDIYIEKIPGIGDYFPYGILSVPLFYISLNGLLLFHGMKALKAFLNYSESGSDAVSNSSDSETILTQYGITPREKEVISLLLQGDSYQRISDSLHISLPTTKRHVYNIYQKTGVKNKIELLNLLNKKV